MKVVTVLGSPRKGSNSTTMAEMVIEKIGGDNVEVVTHKLNNMNYKGCQACLACKGKSERCVLNDDLAQVLLDVSDADLIILASPVYFGDLSAQLKGFFDRTYSYLTPDFMTAETKNRLNPGKKLLFILSQGAGEEMYEDIFHRYNSFFTALGMFESTHLLRGVGLGQDSKVREDSTVRQKVDAVVKELAL